MAMIWIVEDDPKIGLLIEMTIKKAGHETRWFMNGAWLDNALEDGAPLPDLLLLDLMLRAKNGFVILEEWKARQKTSDIPVIIISARSAEADKVRGLDLGAEDYITKPFGIRELQARINTALRRIRPAPKRLTAGPLTLIGETRETWLGSERIDLTSMEFELLSYLVKHEGETVSRSTLLKEVWGYKTDEDLSRTVDSHIKTLRMKLGRLDEKTQLIQTVRGVGYRLIITE